MQFEVQLFAAIRDAAGNDSITVDVGDDPKAADIIDAVGRQLPQVAALLPSCRLAVDSCYVAREAGVSADSDIALIPPVSGG